MKGLKVAVIGAGSTYTPELINGFIARKNNFKISSLFLMDIDRIRLGIVGGLAIRMLKAGDVDCSVILTQSLDEAVEGADYVLAQVRVGKLDARIRDEKIPLKSDLLGQETTGAGGFMNTLRTLPAIMDIARTMQRSAPKAWLFNFSNPSGIVAEAVLNNSDVKMIGLCNVPINMVNDIIKFIPEGTKKTDYDFVGLNHLCWITAVYADGREILQQMLEDGSEHPGLKDALKVAYDKPLLRAMKGIPVSYLKYYCYRDENIRQCKEAEETRGEACKAIEAELLELYKDPQLTTKPAILDKRGGALYSEAAVSLLDAIENNKNEIHVLDVKNNGALNFMDKDDVVEIKCTVNKNGAFPIKIEKFDNHYIIGLMRALKAYEKLTVRAGLEGDYDAALAALLAHPLIGDYHRAKNVLDEMLDANRDFLPQFYKETTL